MAQMAQVDTDRNTNNRSVKKSRNWCFTLNNYDQKDIDTLTQSSCKYIFQEEKGAEGTPHLQGLLCFDNAVSFNSIKKIIPRAHIEPCKNKNASINYCSKGETRCGKVYSNVDKWLSEGGNSAKEKHPYEMDEKEYYDWKMENLPEEFKIFEAWKNWNSARVASLRMRTTPK